ncbi:hypothetical protein [Myxococcus vastator]|uniref:hypothetical protein n=1 Tax=Myxococcus vastator TaxID=2709664 RepID=UPI0019673CE6|nr:hypothetical protein [Myxococcus vastator]
MLLSRLRVCTVTQAYWLHDAFRAVSRQRTRHAPTLRPRTERSTLARLETLVRNGYLRKEPFNPSMGARTRNVYRLRNRGVRVAGQEGNTYLLERPTQEVLEYLLFRNDLYAAARLEGWRIASTLLAPEHESTWLELLGIWTALELRQQLQGLKERGAGPAAQQALSDDLKRLKTTMPQQLTWEFLYRQDSRGLLTDVALLVCDDPRRSVPVQLAQLPAVGLSRARLVLRDVKSTYDATAGRLLEESPRLVKWRKLLLGRYPKSRFPQLHTDELLPGLWNYQLGTSAAPLSPLRMEVST